MKKPKHTPVVRKFIKEKTRLARATWAQQLIADGVYKPVALAVAYLCPASMLPEELIYLRMLAEKIYPANDPEIE